METPDLKIDKQGWAAFKMALANGSPTLAARELQFFTQCQEDEAKALLKHLEHCPYSWPLSDLDEQTLNRIETAFQTIEKPEHFTNYTHCDECEYYDKLLISSTKYNISREKLGNSGSGPMGFANAQGFAYYFPALARYATIGNAFRHYDNYANILINYLKERRSENSFYSWCNREQKQAVTSFLHHLANTQFEQFVPAELRKAIKVWNID